MAINDFWSDLRIAAGFYDPRTTDSAKPDAGRLDRLLSGAARWLSLRTVSAFDPNDFSFLEEKEQKALRASVERFRAVASQVSGGKAATRAQVEEGASAFDDLSRILQLSRYRDAESLRTQVVLERTLEGRLPEWVTGLSCETDTDLDGEPIIRIWLDVTDEAVDEGKIEEEGLQLCDFVGSVYRESGGRLWPFIRPRSPDAFAKRKEEVA